MTSGGEIAITSPIARTMTPRRLPPTHFTPAARTAAALLPRRAPQPLYSRGAPQPLYSAARLGTARGRGDVRRRLRISHEPSRFFWVRGLRCVPRGSAEESAGAGGRGEGCAGLPRGYELQRRDEPAPAQLPSDAAAARRARSRYG